MKDLKKVLLICLCLAAVAAASVLGTLAWLTDSDSAVNTFTVGKVDITLDEEKVTPDGKPTPEEDPRVKENKYHLLPGQSYTKDPTVTVTAGSEESYVRMLVTVNCYDALQKIYNNEFLPQNFVTDWDDEVWISTKEVKVSADGKSATYEFRYCETVDGFDENGEEANEVLPALFKTFTVPDTFDGEDLKALEGLTVRVEGHAIQKAGFEDETTAWEAFDAQMQNAV